MSCVISHCSVTQCKCALIHLRILVMFSTENSFVTPSTSGMQQLRLWHQVSTGDMYRSTEKKEASLRIRDYNYARAIAQKCMYRYLLCYSAASCSINSNNEYNLNNDNYGTCTAKVHVGVIVIFSWLRYPTPKTIIFQKTSLEFFFRRNFAVACTFDGRIEILQNIYEYEICTYSYFPEYVIVALEIIPFFLYRRCENL